MIRFYNYFKDDANFARLLAELEEWRDTPFLKGVARKKVGADCVRFVEAVLVNIGAIDPVIFPKYVTRGGGKRMLQIFMEVMDGIPKMKCVWKADGPWLRPPFQRGDVLLISSGEAMHHLSIVAQPPKLWHCLYEVGEANIFDPIVVNHLKAVYRVKHEH